MDKKTVILNLNSNKSPFELMVLSHKNCLIKKITVPIGHSQICICTDGGVIKLLAKYGNQTIYQKICLNCKKCQNVNVYLSFNNFVSTCNNLFILTDEFYGLPVLEALLNFKQ